MWLGEAVLALFVLPIVLSVPGFLWTFVFEGVSRRMGIVRRVVFSASITVTALPLLIFMASEFAEVPVGIYSILPLCIIVTLFPLVIGYIGRFWPGSRVRDPSAILNEVKQFFYNINKEIKKIPKNKHVILLALVLCIGVVLSLMPHYGYGLPIHTDEWHYMAYADNLIGNDIGNLENPYYGTDAGQHWEIGFIVFISSIKVLSGASWPALFTILPALLFILAILTGYLIGKRYGFGLHSAFVIALAPSTLRFLGPVFLVPIALGFFLFLMSLYLIINHKSKLRYPLLIMTMAFAFLMHPPTGGYTFIGVFGLFVVNLIFKDWRDSIILVAILGLFTLGVFALPQSNLHGLGFSRLLASSRAFMPLIGVRDFMELTSYLPVALGVIGLAFLIYRREKYSVSISAILILLVIFLAVLFYVYPNFFQIQAVFDRAVILLVVLFGLVAGAGLLAVQKNVAKPLFIILLGCVLLLSVNTHINEPYYHIITDDEYQDFIWIGENLNRSYERAVLDPWKAVAFTPVSGKEVYYKIPQGPDTDLDPKARAISSFFANSCIDTGFLVQNGITIVYTRGQCLNSNLIEVHPNVYVLDV